MAQGRAGRRSVLLVVVGQHRETAAVFIDRPDFRRTTLRTEIRSGVIGQEAREHRLLSSFRMCHGLVPRPELLL